MIRVDVQGHVTFLSFVMLEVIALTIKKYCSEYRSIFTVKQVALSKGDIGLNFVGTHTARKESR